MPAESTAAYVAFVPTAAAGFALKTDLLEESLVNGFGFNRAEKARAIAGCSPRLDTISGCRSQCAMSTKPGKRGECVTAYLMKEGPSESAYRSRLQTTFGGCGREAMVVCAEGKGPA